MSKLEQFILISISFCVFLVIFIRVGFFLGSPINSLTLLFALLIFFAGVISVYFLKVFSSQSVFKKFIPLLWFSVFVIFLGLGSWLLSYTYDTSWDGQGYHQSAVIALSNNWNPVYDPSIDFTQNLPSQIFAEGYPSALWEIEATIYSLTDRINSAKIVNIAIAVIAGAIVYSLLRKIKIKKYLAVLISVLCVCQPVYIIQLLTFMADGFGYQLLLIASASLFIIAFSSKSYWAVAVFLMTELLLITTKYSHLPAFLVLGVIFGLIIVNRFLNRDYVFSKYTYYFISGFLLISAIFSYLPYIRNQLFHSALFYPTNIPELMGSVKFNNVPNNLQDSSKVSLLFYGLFSRAQPKESGDPTNSANLAQLKIPFTLSMEEVEEGAELYNNRVGGGGPLFSGLVLLSVLLITFLYFKTENRTQRYAIYISIFTFILILLLSLLAPTPNLLRYTNQLQLIPFVLTVPILAVFKKTYIQTLCLVIISTCTLNVGLFSWAVANKTIKEIAQVNGQMNELRNSGKEYQIRAQQFYSTFTLLKEQNVSFKAVDKLSCSSVKYMVASSTTTQYCFN